MYKALLLIVLGFSIFSSAFSQEANETGRTCRIAFPERQVSSPKMIYLYDGSDNHRLSLSAASLSPVLKLPSGDITLIMAAAPITDAKTIPKAYPKLEIPKDLKDFYLFFSNDKANKELPVKMQLLDYNPEKFKEGDTLWHNFTNHQVAAKFGEFKLSLEAGKSTITAKPIEKSGNYRIEFTYKPNSKGEFRPITEQLWFHDVNNRHLAFFLNGRIPRICLFRDFRSEEETQVDPEPQEGNSP